MAWCSRRVDYCLKNSLGRDTLTQYTLVLPRTIFLVVVLKTRDKPTCKDAIGIRKCMLSYMVELTYVLRTT